MGQTSEDSALPAQGSHEVRIAGQGGMHHLHGDIELLVVDMHGVPDGAVGAFAKCGPKSVVADVLANHGNLGSMVDRTIAWPAGGPASASADMTSTSAINSQPEATFLPSVFSKCFYSCPVVPTGGTIPSPRQH